METRRGSTKERIQQAGLDQRRERWTDRGVEQPLKLIFFHDAPM